MRTLLCLGVASASLLAAAQMASAADSVVWNGGGGVGKGWDNVANWQGGAVPTGSSVVVIQGGLVKNLAVKTAITTDAVAASLEIGQVGSAAKATLVQTQGAGTLSVGSLNILAGGWLQILNTTLATDSAGLTVGTLNMATNSILDIAAGNTVTVTGGFNLAGTAQGAGSLTSAGPIVQTAGKMGIDHLSTTSYSLTGGQTTATTINFSNSFAISGTGSVTDRASTLIGGDGSAMTQSAGMMGGTVSGITSYTQSGGTVGNFVDGFINGKVTTSSYILSGGSMTAEVDFATLFALSDTGSVAATGVLVGSAGSAMTQSGGTMAGMLSGIDSYTQSGGSLTGKVDFTKLFALSDSGSVTTTAVLTGAADSAMTQSGGTMAGTASGISTYTQSGGLLSGSVNALTYNLTGETATSTSGAITASGAFNLGPTSGTAVVAALLSGTGTLIKTGGSTVSLTNRNNSFTGTVSIEAGTLDVVDDSLPDAVAVSIAENATLRMTTLNDTTFSGALSGDLGVLVKEGSAALTLTGDVTLGALNVNAGRLNIGDGTAVMDASFNSALIAAGTTLHVASNATLTVRVPNNLVNYGILINDGTIVDDLENANSFTNNHNNEADVASNTGTITNTSPGVWTGDVKTNRGTISNVDGGKWLGDVEANSSYIHNARGGIWTGDVISNSLYLNNFAGAFWIGDVYDNTGKIGTDAKWTGSVFDNHGMIDQTDNWVGNVVANHGTLWNHDNGIWDGDVESNAGTIKNWNSWKGDVLDNTGSIVVANNIDSTNHAVTFGVWTGDVFDNHSSIDQTGHWIGDIFANHGTVWNHGVGVWDGDVESNAGTITNTGIWTGDFASSGTVNAENTINGSFDNSGVLNVTGALAGITVLTNTGTLDLTGAGDEVFTVGSASIGSDAVFAVSVLAGGLSNRMNVTGDAALAGDVRVTAMGGTYDLDTAYTIVSAGNISAQFTGVSTDLEFLTPKLTQDATSVILTVKRNDIGFAEAGSTSNQQATAEGVEALGAHNAIYDALLWLNQDQAQAAFDDLSGEVYVTASGVAIDNEMRIGDIATRHVDQLFDKLEEMEPTAYAGIAAVTDDAPASLGLWGQIYGAYGSLAADGTTSGVDASSWGIVAGLDGILDDWRVGMLVHGGATDMNVAELSSTATSSDYGVSLYGGRQWGDLQLSMGASYTQSQIDTERQVDMQGFTDKLSAKYGAATSSAFGQLSYRIIFGAASLTPYASLAHVSHTTDGFEESGGDAALSSDFDLVNATFTTLGAHIEQKFLLGDGMLLTTKAGLGWRHAIADPAEASHAFVGGPSFVIAGTPIAEDTGVLSASVNLDIDTATTLDLSYDGQLGDGAQSHSVTGTFAKQF